MDDEDIYDGCAYKYPQIFIQMGKILDSRENPFPKTKVVTDDGWVYEVTFDEAETIMDLIRETPSNTRRVLTEKIQNSKGFESIMKLVFGITYS